MLSLAEVRVSRLFPDTASLILWRRCKAYAAPSHNPSKSPIYLIFLGVFIAMNLSSR
jgi:hypothetical protein